MENVKDWHLQNLAGIYKKAISVVLERSKKYATEEDPFLNFRRSAAFAGTSVSQGIMNRIGDKLSRLQNTLATDGADGEFSDESFDDTVVDLCNYFVILRNWRLVEREERAESEGRQLALFDPEPEPEPAEEPSTPGFAEKAIRGVARTLGVTVD